MKIVLYGAGQKGIRALRELGTSHVDAFLDAKVKGECCVIPVYTVDEYCSVRGGGPKTCSDTLVLLTSVAHARSMIQELRKYGVQHCFSYQEGKRFVVDADARLDAEEWGDIDQEEELQGLLQRVKSETPPNSWTGKPRLRNRMRERADLSLSGESWAKCDGAGLCEKIRAACPAGSGRSWHQTERCPGGCDKAAAIFRRRI